MRVLGGGGGAGGGGGGGLHCARSTKQTLSGVYIKHEVLF